MDNHAPIGSMSGSYFLPQQPQKNLEELKSLMRLDSGAPLIEELNVRYYPQEILQPLLAYADKEIPFMESVSSSLFRLLLNTKSYTHGVLAKIYVDARDNNEINFAVNLRSESVFRSKALDAAILEADARKRDLQEGDEIIDELSKIKSIFASEKSIGHNV
jgi:hypothetical protein